MKRQYTHVITLIAMPLVAFINTVQAAESITEALVSGKAYGDFNLRYEAVDQRNPLADADAMTLRSRLGYRTAEFKGVSAVIEVEDSRTVLGFSDFSVPPTGFKPGQFSVIADPQTTEVDQGYIQYKSAGFTGRLGRQVITLDNHRFVGHVGWRQDRQTFDGLSLTYKPNDKIGLYAAVINQRNRIFAEARDIDSQDTLINASYKTPYGKFTTYAYLLEDDAPSGAAIDTLGLRFNGSSKAESAKFLYSAEFARQEFNDLIETNYLLIEGGVQFSGITAKLGIESLGSDNGLGGFATPLATLHKFNGWADTFLGTPKQGLEDVYLTVSGKLAGGKLLATYHDFSSDKTLLGSDDLGNEFDIVYSRKLGKHYYTGIKFATYSAGDKAFAKVDTDKLWLWAGLKF